MDTFNAVDNSTTRRYKYAVSLSEVTLSREILVKNNNYASVLQVLQSDPNYDLVDLTVLYNLDPVDVLFNWYSLNPMLMDKFIQWVEAFVASGYDVKETLLITGSLQTRFDKWLNEKKHFSEIEKKQVERIRSIQEVLLRPENYPLTTSQVIYKRIKMLLSLRKRDTKDPISRLDPLALFDSLAPSDEVPYIHIQLENSPVYKIHRSTEPKTTEETINNSFPVSPSNGFMYIILWVGKKTIQRTVERNVSENYVKMSIELKTGTAEIFTTVGNERMGRIQEILQNKMNLEVFHEKDKHVSASFEVFNYNPSEVAIMRLLYMNTPPSFYLFLNETDDPYAMKKKFELQYRAASLDSLEFFRSRVRFEIQPIRYTLPDDSPRCLVDVIEAGTRQDILEFQRILTYLLAYIKRVTREVEAIHWYSVYAFDPKVSVLIDDWNKELPASILGSGNMIRYEMFNPPDANRNPTITYPEDERIQEIIRRTNVNIQEFYFVLESVIKINWYVQITYNYVKIIQNPGVSQALEIIGNQVVVLMNLLKGVLSGSDSAIRILTEYPYVILSYKNYQRYVLLTSFVTDDPEFKKVVRGLRELFEPRLKSLDLRGNLEPEKKKKQNPAKFKGKSTQQQNGTPIGVTDMQEVESLLKKGVRILPYPPNVLDNSLQQARMGNPPDFFFFCNNPKYPNFIYPAYKKDTDDDDASEGSYIPVCNKSDPLLRPNSATSKAIRESTGQNALEESTSTSALPDLNPDRILTPDTILDPGRVGYLQTHVVDLLTLLNFPGEPVYDHEKKVYVNKPEPRRIGTVNDNSCLLHSCLTAIDMKYQSIATIDGRKKYISQFREFLAKSDLSYLRQELYDMTVEEISENLRNPGYYLDPLRWYRLMEEYFKCSIFIFTRNPDSLFGEFVGARYLTTPSRRPNHFNKVILLYLTAGAKRKMSKATAARPHCELVIRILDNKPSTLEDYMYLVDSHGRYFQGVFPGERLESLLYNVLCDKETSLTWDNTKTRSAVTNRYSVMRILAFISNDKRRATHQILDSKGKMRGLVIEVRPNQPTSYLYTILFPCQPPEILPVMELKDAPLVDPINLLDPDLTTKRPSGVLRNLEKQIVSAWYPFLDLNEALQVPTKPGRDPFPDVPDSSSKVTLSDRTSLSSDVFLERTATRLKTILRWLFLHTESSPEEFMSNLCVVTPSSYNLGVLPSELPNFHHDINRALLWLGSFDTGLLLDSRIRLNSQELAKGIYLLLRQAAKTDFRKPPANFPLTGLVASEFTKHPSMIIFFRYEDMIRYRESLQYNDNLVLLTTLGIEDADKRQPFCYQDKGGKIYLIQNVVQGDFYRSLACSISWKRDGVNTGYETKPTQSQDSFNIYSILKDGTLGLLYTNRVIDSGESLNILRYFSHNQQLDEGRSSAKVECYAALLPLT